MGKGLFKIVFILLAFFIGVYFLKNHFESIHFEIPILELIALLSPIPAILIAYQIIITYVRHRKANKYDDDDLFKRYGSNNNVNYPGTRI